MSLGAASHTEVIVIGAGALGASTAAHLAERCHAKLEGETSDQFAGQPG